MFKPREALEPGQGGPHGPVLLGAGHAIGSQIVAAPIARDWRTRLAAVDWAPDLAHDIGSRRWFRGLGTLLALAAAALAFTPELARVEAAEPHLTARDQRDQLASLGTAPLAYGAESGRRSAPGPLVRPAIGPVAERAQVSLVAVLGGGDDLAGLLTRAGAPAIDAFAARNLIGSAVAVGELTPGTPVDITLARAADGSHRLQRLALRARFDLALTVLRAPGGPLGLVRQPIAVDTTPLRIRGTVGASLYRSARAAGAPAEAAAQYLQALDRHLALDTDIAPGDTFDIVVAFKRSATGEVQVGDLLYAGLDRGGKPRAQLLRWGSDGQFFDADSMGAQRTGLLMPVVGHITSTFGARRHPILGYTRMHAGVDFGAAWGSPIYAVGDATVVFAGWHGGHGNFVKLDHGSGFGTGYGHMSRIAVSPGEHVRAGQVIGYVGSTGLSTGPHLHYELYRGGVPVNPLTTQFTVAQAVDPAELKAFRSRLAQLRAVRPGAALGPAVLASTASPTREIARAGI